MEMSDRSGGLPRLSLLRTGLATFTAYGSSTFKTVSTVRSFSKANLLIIDDLFKDKVKNGKLLPSGLTEADLKHIYRILNVRYNNHSPIIVSSECTPKMLMNLDEAMARRILEPCGKNIIVFGKGWMMAG